MTEEAVTPTQAVIAEALHDNVVPISALNHHPENPKLGQVSAIQESLARFGQVRPILVQEGTMYVLAGNHTLKAAKALGWQEIAAVVIPMEEEEALAYVLADNRTADLGTYDDVALLAALDKLGDAALGGTGFTPEDRQDMHDTMADLDKLDGIHPEERVKIDDLKAHPGNYQQHPEEQLEHLGKSLTEHGFYRHVVIAEDGTILAGHGLVQAAAKIGLKRVPVVRLPISPDSAEAVKVMAGDNELNKLAERDDRALTEMLKEVKESGDVGALLGTGFDAQTLANLVFVTRPEAEVRNFNAAAEWVGLPEFQPGADRVTLVVSFDTEEQRDELVEKLGLIIAKKRKMTWSAWWPPREQEDLSSLYYGPDEIEAAAKEAAAELGMGAWDTLTDEEQEECRRMAAENLTAAGAEETPPPAPAEAQATGDETTEGSMGGVETPDAAVPDPDADSVPAA